MDLKIETERLVLRKLLTSDADFVFKLLNSPGWLKYIGDKKITDAESARRYIEETLFPLYANPGFGPFGLELKPTRNLIGFCGLFKREYLKHPDIGFALLPEYEGKGYAYESAKRVIEYAKGLDHLCTIHGITVKNNFRSATLLEKLGLEFERMVNHTETGEILCLYSANLKQL